jgi:hypothetical protein
MAAEGNTGNAEDMTSYTGTAKALHWTILALLIV